MLFIEPQIYRVKVANIQTNYQGEPIRCSFSSVSYTYGYIIRESWKGFKLSQELLLMFIYA